MYEAKQQMGTIPLELYEATADTLMGALFNRNTFSYEDPKNDLRAFFQHNLFAFSAAKSFTEMQAFAALLVAPDGTRRSFAQFRQLVAQTGALFNSNYLQAEYNTALASADMADLWNSFADESILQYSTVHDDRVRPEHAILDGITAPKSDSIWRKIYPPLAFNCRCTVIPGLMENVKTHDVKHLSKEAKIQPFFKNNSALSKVIFKDDMPYFETLGKEKPNILTAVRDYNMPTVEKLYENNSFQPYKTTNTIEEADNWFTQQAGDLRGAIEVKAITGNTYKVYNDFRNKILHKRDKSRVTYFTNVVDVLTAADEVWSIRKGNKLVTKFIKYYEQHPIIVLCNEDLIAYSIHDGLKNGDFIPELIDENRMGILLYRKN